MVQVENQTKKNLEQALFCVLFQGKTFGQTSNVESVEFIALYTWELFIRTNNTNDEKIYDISCCQGASLQCSNVVKKEN